LELERECPKEGETSADTGPNLGLKYDAKMGYCQLVNNIKGFKGLAGKNVAEKSGMLGGSAKT